MTTEEPPRPAFHAFVAALVAAPLAEVAAGALAQAAIDGGPPPAALLVACSGFGVGAGVAWATAETLARRHLALGLLAGLALALLAPLGGEYGLALLEGGGSVDATGRAVASLSLAA
jgi:hypothetical protein